MSLDALWKPPFTAIFQLFSHGFLRVFRRPFSEVRKLGWNKPQKRWFWATFDREPVRRGFQPFERNPRPKMALDIRSSQVRQESRST
jgi:hypothetical protein